MPPPPPGSGERDTLASERGVERVPIPTRGQTLWYHFYKDNPNFDMSDFIESSTYIFTIYLYVFICFTFTSRSWQLQKCYPRVFARKKLSTIFYKCTLTRNSRTDLFDTYSYITFLHRSTMVYSTSAKLSCTLNIFKIYVQIQDTFYSVDAV